MNFTPSAQAALVYREFHFIATSVPAPVRITPIPQIFDEIAQDIRAMFLEVPEASEPYKKLQHS